MLRRDLAGGDEWRDSLLRALLMAAVLSSLIHYTDNAVAIEDFPGPDLVTPGVVVAAWLILTPFAALGYYLYRQRRVTAAAACLAVYSVSGLSSIGHYTQAIPGEIGLVHEVTIATDVITGAAVLGFAIWAAAAFRRGQLAA